MAEDPIDVTALAHIVELYKDTTAEMTRLKKVRDDLNAALKDAIGEHDVATVGGVPALRRQVVAGRKFDEATFRDECPDLYARYLIDTAQVRLTIVK